MPTLHEDAPRQGTKPTGRRPVSARQIEMQERLTGRLPAVPLARARAAAEAVAPVLEVSTNAAHLLSRLFAYSRACDWEDGRMRIVYPSNDTLSAQTNLPIRSVQRALRELIDNGLVSPIDGGTGRRGGYRDATGYIASVSSGIDLSPIGERIEELERLVEEHRARLEEARRIKGQIRHARNRVLALCDRGLEADPEDAEWKATADKARALGKVAKGERDVARLAERLGWLRALKAVAEARTLAQASVKESPQGADSDTPPTTTNETPIANAIAPGRLRPAHESSGGGSVRGPGEGAAATQTSALRGFPMTPDFVLKIAPPFRDWVRSSTPSWPELTDAADLVRTSLGISKHVWGQACIVLGRVEATSAVAAITAKHRAGLVRSPGGLLRHMVDAHLKGELRLDRTLFGLADAMGGLGRKSAGDREEARRSRRHLGLPGR